MMAIKAIASEQLEITGPDTITYMHSSYPDSLIMESPSC